jgi:ribosomal-protein-alanine N-acetyltransferase
MEHRTARLILRDFVEEDWEAVLAYQSMPEYLRFYEWTERTPEDVQAFVRMFIAQQQERPRRKFQLAIVLPESGQLIGNCGVRVRDPILRAADIGYELDHRYWGCGYATEAARAMLAFGFDHLDMHRIAANCVADNLGSARVLEKIGMQREGRFREHEWYKGRWWDTLYYAMLASEWHGSRPS